ncbi:type II toxin-antitoxin system PemK/MazF family toxin [Leptolyngbya sp. NIES-2104]|uniref:type II toxin-antitoxin system PemK/MazF family toxin n=1 Tax=Leptolyngbya sp. NIES-2104 TaxID=1552121 RepID=UPI00192D0452|nr:type II toxin-antitoxin system PemK/MazF family toxin [Leptolyngbya sp. NIES-2104]
MWLVNFDPTVGSEIKKVRPAIIVSSDQIGRLPLKLIAPITDWKSYFEQNLWHIQIQPDIQNGLSKVSAIDALQIRGVDVQRINRKLGEASETIMQELGIAIVSIIEFQPE